MKRGGTMTRSLTLFALAISAAMTATAGDDIAALLQAHPVRQTMVFTVAPAKGGAVVTYVADGHNTYVLHDDDTVAATGVVTFAYHNFNPFKVAVTVKETSAPEPSLKGLAEFLDAL